jgi:hypothetical protein
VREPGVVVIVVGWVTVMMTDMFWVVPEASVTAMFPLRVLPAGTWEGSNVTVTGTPVEGPADPEDGEAESH